MGIDSFDHLETLFHELLPMDADQRSARLGEIARTDQELADRLESLVRSADDAGGFLDETTIDASFPQLIDITLDGSTVIAGRYAVREVIGVGASSTVFRASTTNPDRDVALKVLRFGLDSARARERFERESVAQASLDHPHVAHVYETGEHRFSSVSVPWIAMELVEGARSIRELADDRARSQEDNRALFSQILHAVHAAHGQGVVHLDLNASNILIDRHGFPRIIDFGLAGFRPGGSAIGASVGTRSSMAPEQMLVRTSPFDARTDVYALALLYLELVHGVRLQVFPDLDDDEARRLIRIGKPGELLGEISEIDADTKELLSRMLRVDPNQRPAGLDEVIPVLGQPASVAQPAATSVRLLSGLALTAAFVAIVGIALVVRPGPGGTDSGSPAGNAGGDQHGTGIELMPDAAMSIADLNPRHLRHAPEIDEAIDSIATALLASDSMDPAEAAPLHETLADRYQISSRYEEAVGQYRLAVDAYERASDAPSVNRARLDLAELLLYLNRPDIAERELDRIQRGNGQSPVFMIELGIAEITLLDLRGLPGQALGLLAETRERLEEVVSEDPSTLVDRLLELAHLSAEHGSDNLRFDFLELARETADAANPTHPELRPVVSVSYASAAFDRADRSTHGPMISMVSEAVRELDSTTDAYHAAWARRYLGHMLAATGRTEEAVAEYEDALRSLRQLFGDDHLDVIVTGAYLRLASGDDDAFWATLDRLRERLGESHAWLDRLELAHELHHAGP